MSDSCIVSSMFWLPPEIWLHIVAIAAAPSVLLVPSSQRPFDVYSFDPVAYQQTLNIKRALACTSTNFRDMVIPYLYSELKLADTTDQLCQILGHTNRSYGRYVRTVIIPYSSTQTPTYKSSFAVLSILRLCPNVQTIIRPSPPMCGGGFRYEYEIDALPSQASGLKNLYWHHSEMAAVSGGVNNLHYVLSKAPNLEFLSIRGGLGCNYRHNGPAELRALRKLHIRRINPLFARQVSLWPLQALQHVVVDCAIPNRALEIIWTAFGSQLLSVEFGHDLSFMLNDELAACLRGCPNIRHLMLYPFFHLPFDVPDVHHGLDTISMHMRPNELLRQSSPDAEWEHLKTFFTRFLSSSFPTLKALQLFGDWTVMESLFADQRFTEFRQLAQSRGCMLKVMRPNGTAIHVC